MKNGRLIAPIWLANGNLRPDGTREHMPSVSGCIFSDDHGETWQIIQEIDSLGGYADLGLHQGKACIFYECYSPERHIVDELVLKIFQQQESM
ncbi:MAG: sialidase family protein [Clostridiales bacterium]|nr:sialidase family protein [Clostridiales bacterium]